MTKASEIFKAGKNNIGYVSSSFLSEFGNEEVLPGSILQSQVLKRDMKDSEIINKLNIQECSLGDILVTLEKATSEMKDGRWNIFYVKGHSLVVSVHWRGGAWDVDGWDRDGGGWFEGLRVFSPATGPKPSESVSSDPLKLAYCECERCEKCGKFVR